MSDSFSLSRLLPHINSSSNFNSFQSAYRPHHSTETALTFTLDNVFHVADTGSATLLVSLDLSAAFDSINHNILINRLSCFGLTGLALDWISSYLHNRRQSVKIGDACSPLSDITSGVPQGSVLGPILFALYTSPISAIADVHGVLQQQYADDTQLYISVSAKTIAPNTRRLEACLSDLHAWFSHNWLALNPSKSEALLLGTSQRLKTLATLGSVNISGTTVPLTTQIKLLGVTLDQSLSFDSHITALSKSCFYHIRALRHIRPILSEGTANLIASALVSSRLDYANACLFGISNKNLSRIQKIQNTLARVVTFSRSRSSTAPLLKHLHWLPVSARIHFKIALLTFKSLHAIASSYLSSLVRPYVPSRALRSSSAHQLCVPHVSTVFGSRGFRSAGPTIWNSLPLSVTSCSTIHTFKKQLKTHLFASAFPSSWIVLDAPHLIRWSPFIYLVVLDFVRA